MMIGWFFSGIFSRKDNTESPPWLKSCPFCGENPSVNLRPIGMIPDGCIDVRLGCDGCKVYLYAKTEGGNTSITALEDVIKKLSDTWNNRADEEEFE